MMKRFKIKWVLGAITIVFLILLLLYLQGVIGGGKIEKEAPHGLELPENLEIMRVAKAKVGEDLGFVGTICSKTKATISSKVVARIEKIYVKSGDKVKKGDILIKLEDKDMRAKLQQAVAALDAARSNLGQAEADYRRYKNLFEDRTITQQEFERAETGYKTAKAQLNQAENAKKETEAFLNYTIIRAPFSGLIVKKHAEEGDMASPGRPLLFMYDPADIWFESQVPSSQSHLLAIGLNAKVTINAVKEEFEGSIVEIVPAVDPGSRTVTVRIDIPKDKRLKCGMYGSFDIASGETVTILIPRRAIVRVGQLDSVYVVANGELELRNISIGKEYGDKIEVLSGLSEGEEIVLDPQEFKDMVE